jgi:hypothetical protein
MRQPHAFISDAGMTRFNNTPSDAANTTATCWLADCHEQ